MKMSKWTRVLLSAGLISLPAALRADDTNAPAAPQPSTVLTSLSATTLSGYIDTSATWAFGTGNANLPGRVYDGPDTQDGFNMNVVSLTLNKPLDVSPWAAGYNVQTLFGPGAKKRGTGLFGSSGTTEVAFNEAYINLHVPVGNGLELHLGQFGTFNGYEAYDTYKNPNWSRSYGFFIESSAHTGVAATYKLCDYCTIQAGVGNVAGFNNQVDAKSSIESKKAYLGMVTFTAPESFGFMKGATASIGYTYGDAVSVGTVSGRPFTPGATRYDQGNLYVGVTTPLPVAGLSLGAAYDYTSGSAFKDSYANALAGYLSWQITEKLKKARADLKKGTEKKDN